MAFNQYLRRGSLRRVELLAMIGVTALLTACGGGSSNVSGAAGGVISNAPAASDSSLAVAAPPNVQVSHDRFRGHLEPDLAVNPTNHNLLVASQIVVASHLIVPGTYTSQDGGESWRDNGPLPMPTGFPGGADTTVAFDSLGSGYVVSLASDQVGGGTPSRTRAGEILLWRTEDGGRTFPRPTEIYRGAGFQDHPWLAIDRSQPSQPLFVAWGNQQGLEFAVSRDGGRQFGSARLLVASHDALGFTPVVLAAKRRVYVLYQELGSSSITIQCLHSQDGGMSFDGPISVGTVIEPALIGEVPKKQAGPPPLFSAATDATGADVYAAISAFDRAAGHPVDLLWRSSAQGQTWSGPVAIATGSAASLTQTQPRLAVGRTGDIYALYLATDRDGRVGVRLSDAIDGGAQFGADRWISSRLSSANSWVARNHGWFGDYQALSVDSDTLHAVWNDDRTGMVELMSAQLHIR